MREFSESTWLETNKICILFSINRRRDKCSAGCGVHLCAHGQQICCRGIFEAWYRADLRCRGGSCLQPHKHGLLPDRAGGKGDHRPRQCTERHPRSTCKMIKTAPRKICGLLQTEDTAAPSAIRPREKRVFSLVFHRPRKQGGQYYY